MINSYILVFHFVVAVALIGLILLQQGKGAEAGASFGSGASQTVFGSSGSWNFFSKSTAVLATIFFVTSISLAVIAKNRSIVDESFISESQELQGTEKGVSDIPETQDEQIPVDDLSDLPLE
tara:strand:+ start:220 stop:585 length:366 start_codon:yes stop_codon:yes gene_type:complete